MGFRMIMIPSTSASTLIALLISLPYLILDIDTNEPFDQLAQGGFGVRCLLPNGTICIVPASSLGTSCICPGVIGTQGFVIQ